MKWLSGILLFFLLLMQSACEEIFFYNCADCLESEPVEGTLYINVSGYNQFTTYEITVYQGKVEDNIIIAELTSNTNVEIQVQLNKEYSVKVISTFNGIEYIAVSSATPRVKFSEDYCEIPCYFIRDNEINARIKYH
ncbi:MAG: hypothetical protein V2I37_11720 [Marinilabiliaceae bacterium]|nr:hypothetical protein [Marinilabiliaceae bacterium]